MNPQTEKGSRDKDYESQADGFSQSCFSRVHTDLENLELLGNIEKP